MRKKFKTKWKTIEETIAMWVIFGLIFTIQVLASNEPVFNQTINSAAFAVDIVDENGNSVEHPTVNFGAVTFSFSEQTSHGQLGTDSQRIRANNPSDIETWTVNLSGSSNSATWTSSENHYHFNDASGGGYANGQMTVDPSTGAISGVAGCLTDHISKGNSESFADGSVDSIDIMTASTGTATSCQWDFIGAADNITQKIPAGQAVGSYSLDMTVSIQ